MAKTKTRPTPKRRPKAKPVATRPDRPSGRRLNLRIHDLHYARLCEMAAADGLTVTSWLVRMIDREHERRDSGRSCSRPAARASPRARTYARELGYAVYEYDRTAKS